MGGIGRLMELAASANAVAVGPGLGRDEETRSLVLEILERFEGPVLADADGLNAIADAGAEKVLTGRKGATVLTPHPGEMARLLELASPALVEQDRWGIAREASSRWRCTILLKGAATVTASPGRLLAVNRTGHPAMAQGGMGDTLTGMILSLLGQGVQAHEAAAVSAFLHGRAGEKAGHDSGTLGITAGSLIYHLGTAAVELTGPPEATSWVD
jgi:NAD(P)H-hydrate epimerase